PFFLLILHGPPSSAPFPYTTLFRSDIAPQAPVHVLFVPKESFATLNDVPRDRPEVVGRLALAAAAYARAQGFAEDGYRIVMNCNGNGGQTVFQIHLHLPAEIGRAACRERW